MAHLDARIRTALARSGTAVSYRPGVRAFRRYCTRHGLSSRPPSVDAADRLLCGFVFDLMERDLRHSTMRNYICAVRHSWWCRLPSDSPVVTATLRRPKLLIREWRKSSGLCDLFANPLPASWLPLSLAHPDPVVPALLVVAFLFFTRASELTRGVATGDRFTSRDLSVSADRVSIFIRLSKTDPGRGSVHERSAIPGNALCPVRLVSRYLSSRRYNDPSDPAFQWRDGSAVSSKQLTGLVRSLASAAGASPSFFSSHSLRAGGACAAAHRGEAFLMREGRWASVRSFKPYLRLASAAGASASAPMLASTFVPFVDPARSRHRAHAAA